MASYGLPAQAKATPRPDPLLFLGGPACRSPGIRSQRASQGHFNGFLWASSASKSYRTARSIAFSGRSSVPLARHLQPTGIPRPHPWLFMGVQACRLPALKRSKRLSSAGKSYPKARSIAVSRRSSVPFARHSQPTGIPRPHQWLLMGFQRRQKLPQGQIHCFFWAVQRAVGQAFAANRHPKATSMAFYGRPSLPFASPKTLQTPKTPKRPLASYGLPAQAKATPRPDPLLFLGGPACRSPGIRSQRASQGHINGFLWASSAGKSYPKARSIAFSGRSSVPLARHSQPTGIPRPHPWLFMGVQACRVPALKRSKPLKPLKGHFNGFLWASSAGKSYPKARSIAVSGRSSVPFARHSQPTGIPRPLQWLLMGFQRRQKLPQGQIHCFFWAVQRAVGQAFAANRHPKATSMAFYGRPSLPFASPKTLQAFAANGHPKATSMVSYGLSAQAKATPRPDRLLFLGGPACCWPGIRSQQASQGHIHGFLWASKLAVCQP